MASASGVGAGAPGPSRKRPRSPSPPPPAHRRSAGGRARVIESDDEEDDSDMDDFIDDSDAKMDISAQIRNIFGYDRRKFRDEEDFDDRSMECNRSGAQCGVLFHTFLTLYFYYTLYIFNILLSLESAHKKVPLTRSLLFFDYANDSAHHSH